MCTAFTYCTKDFYFGRNLDYEYSYGETVTVTPRNYNFSDGLFSGSHYALVGMAYVQNGYPLYYDAANEHGLCMAGLNFPDYAVYLPYQEDKKNIPPFAFIPWILGQCKTVRQAKELLRQTNLVHIPFSEELPLTPLHWLIADREETITVEPREHGLEVYDNAIGVLTNNPPFPMQLFALNNYPYLSKDAPSQQFCEKIPLHAYSRGLGALGLPGDLSSQSRFIRGAFCRVNAYSENTEEDSVGQFFHMLGFVEQPRGCVRLKPQVYEMTLYSSCINASQGIYYYTTYENRRICAVDMQKENLDSKLLISYPLLKNQDMLFQNGG